MKSKIEKLKELVFPDLPLHKFPEEVIYDPLLHGWSEDASDASPRLSSVYHFLFRMIVGLILFICKQRFDCLHVISLLSSRTHRPSALDLEAAYHLSKFLCYTRHIPLVFYPAEEGNEVTVTVEGAGDSAFRSCKNNKSQQGIGLKVVTHPKKGMSSPSGMAMASSRASRGILDTTVNDSETHVCLEIGKDGIWFQLLLKDIFGKDYDTPIKIYTDNMALEQNLKTFMLSRNQRHIRAAIHFLKQQNELNILDIQWEAGEKMQVDTLTKSLPTTKKAQDMVMLLGESEPLSTFIDTVKNRPRSSYRNRINSSTDPNNPLVNHSIHELINISKDTDYNHMDNDEEEMLINLAYLAIENTDLNIIQSSNFTTAIIHPEISHLSTIDQDHYRIRQALQSDIVLNALVYYDLHSKHPTIIDNHPTVMINRVHWDEVVSLRILNVDENDILYNTVFDVQGPILSGFPIDETSNMRTLNDKTVNSNNISKISHKGNNANNKYKLKRLLKFSSKVDATC